MGSLVVRSDYLRQGFAVMMCVNFAIMLARDHELDVIAYVAESNEKGVNLTKKFAAKTIDHFSTLLLTPKVEGNLMPRAGVLQIL